MATNMAGLEEKIRVTAARIRDDAADKVLAACKEDCPVGADTPTRKTPPGTLRDSLTIFGTEDRSPSFTATVGSTLEYASFTDEEDTAAHLIVARNAPMLRFWWENGPGGAGIYYFRFVNHPGTKGQHWFASKNPDRWNAALAEVV